MGGERGRRVGQRRRERTQAAVHTGRNRAAAGAPGMQAGPPPAPLASWLTRDAVERDALVQGHGPLEPDDGLVAGRPILGVDALNQVQHKPASRSRREAARSREGGRFGRRGQAAAAAGTDAQARAGASRSSRSRQAPPTPTQRTAAAPRRPCRPPCRAAPTGEERRTVRASVASGRPTAEPHSTAAAAAQLDSGLPHRAAEVTWTSTSLPRHSGCIASTCSKAC